MVNEAKQKPPRRYEKMRDSGVEWIGMVPEAWNMQSAGKLFREVKEKNSRNQYNNAFSFRYGEIVDKKNSGSENERLNDTLSAYQIVTPNDIVLNGLNLNYDFISQRVAIVREKGIITSAYLVVRPNSQVLHPRFVLYLLKAFDFRQVFHCIGSGIRKTLKFQDFKELPIIYPNLATQAFIVKYLDEKVKTIDVIIAEAKASIEEYKAWKASIIYEAVTKGLDPHAEMKDSGVKWIGEIPKHWGTTALKRICKRISDGSHYSPPTTAFGFPYVTAGDVHGKGIDYAKCKTISKNDFDLLVKTNCQPHLGDVLLVKDGATTGRVGLMTDDGPCVLLSSVAMLTPSNGISSEYLMYLLESDVFQYQIKKTMAGSAMPRTTLSKLMAYTAILCPFDEQVGIVKYLNAKCSLIEDLISEKQSLISELESYKKSLIYEVVTGKRKVV